MALDYLRQSSINYSNDGTAASSTNSQSEKKRLPLRKFLLLLSGNLVVWVVFAVSLLDVDALSMDNISKARLPRERIISFAL